jgi:hypothetical protein
VGGLEGGPHFPPKISLLTRSSAAEVKERGEKKSSSRKRKFGCLELDYSLMPCMVGYINFGRK